jgi:hypothetical protein
MGNEIMQVAKVENVRVVLEKEKAGKLERSKATR